MLRINDLLEIDTRLPFWTYEPDQSIGWDISTIYSCAILLSQHAQYSRFLTKHGIIWINNIALQRAINDKTICTTDVR